MRAPILGAVAASDMPIADRRGEQESAGRESGWLFGWVDRCIPVELLEDSTVRIRARVLVVSCIGCGVLTAIAQIVRGLTMPLNFGFWAGLVARPPASICRWVSPDLDRSVGVVRGISRNFEEFRGVSRNYEEFRGVSGCSSGLSLYSLRFTRGGHSCAGVGRHVGMSLLGGRARASEPGGQ